MALSYYSEWDTIQQIKPERTSFLQAEPEPLEELLDLHFDFDAADFSLDQLLEESNDLLQSDNFDDVLQYLNFSPEGSVSVLPDILPTENIEPLYCQESQMMDGDHFSYIDTSSGFLNDSVLNYSPPLEQLPELVPTENFETLHCPKRQKIDENHFGYLDTSPAFLNDSMLNYGPLVEPLPEFVPSLPEFPVPPRFTFGHAETVQKSDAGLSQQSVAARQRRRKIADKLQDLGKLVPGGNKMNTAEMLKAAFKYVEFLQAQVGIMELMGSTKQVEIPTHSDEIPFLLPSPVIQEKLYSKEKCLVPQEFVQKVANGHMFECKSSVIKEIGHIMQAHNFPSQNEINYA